MTQAHKSMPEENEQQKEPESLPPLRIGFTPEQFEQVIKEDDPFGQYILKVIDEIRQARLKIDPKSEIHTFVREQKPDRRLAIGEPGPKPESNQ